MPTEFGPKNDAKHSAAHRAAEETRWLNENSAALDAANTFVESRGLPLARHRSF